VVRVFHDQGFRDFQLDRGGIGAALIDNSGKQVDFIHVGQLKAGNIDAHKRGSQVGKGFGKVTEEPFLILKGLFQGEAA